MKGLSKIAVVVNQPAADYYSDLNITPDPEFVGYNTRLHPALRNPEMLGYPLTGIWKALYKPEVQAEIRRKELLRKKRQREF